MSERAHPGRARIGRALCVLFLPVMVACPRPDAPEREEGLAEAPSAMTDVEAEHIWADSAELIHDRVLEAMGGQEAWDRTRFLSFRWQVEREGEVVSDRRHAWDRYDGLYRLETERNGVAEVAIFHVNELDEEGDLGKVPAGDAWRNGQRLEGAARDSVLAQGYRAFINDTYWLLMPYKWRDPGVELEFAGRDTLPDGRAYEVVHLSFDDDVGLTTDEYWGYVDRETGLMTAWRFHLEGQEEPGPIVWWEDWQPVGPGPIQVAKLRRPEEGPTRIRFAEVEAAAEVPPGAFDPPEG